MYRKYIAWTALSASLLSGALRTVSRYGSGHYEDAWAIIDALWFSATFIYLVLMAFEKMNQFVTFGTIFLAPFNLLVVFAQAQWWVGIWAYPIEATVQWFWLITWILIPPIDMLLHLLGKRHPKVERTK